MLNLQSTDALATAPAIIAMERAALDRSAKGDPGGFLDISDPGVVYFDPFLEEPIRGLEALRSYYQDSSGLEPGSGEMTNANVQVFGDIAVLTFNYLTTLQASRRIIGWNATEVYRRSMGAWRIVHTHWSFLRPQLAQPQ
jgi:ketosteroid isomerase-like protein